MAANQSGTFTYSPDVQVLISTTQSGDIDVSVDVMDFQMDRQINAVSTFTCTLANPGRKYNRIINTMDRIVVYLKRTNWVQTFSGYITYAPIETFVPTPVQIRASCTLKILQNTYWDDTLLQYQKLLLNYMDSTASSSAKTYGDGGVAQALVNLLYKVAGWDPKNIHIQGIPTDLVQMAAQSYESLATGKNKLDQDLIQKLAALLQTADIISGSTTNTGTTATNGGSSNTDSVNTKNAPDGGVGTAVVVTNAVALDIQHTQNGGKKNFPQPNNDNPVNNYKLLTEDIYYCSAHWSYLDLPADVGPPAPGQTLPNQGKVLRAKHFLAQNQIHKNQFSGRLCVVYNPDTGRVVVLRATSVPQDNSGKYDLSQQSLQVHPGVLAYLAAAKDSKDPTKAQLPGSVTSCNIKMGWLDVASGVWGGSVGPQTKLSDGLQQSLQGLTGNAAKVTGTTADEAITTLISALRAQIGSVYSQGAANDRKAGHPQFTLGREIPKTSTHNGYFDCSGLAQWGYKQIGINILYDTKTQLGSRSSKDNDTCGQYLTVNQKPQKGDLLFWATSPGGTSEHVMILSENFDNQGNGKVIQAYQWGTPLGEQSINWNDFKGGKAPPGWGSMYYLGARRPITLHSGADWHVSPYAAPLDPVWTGTPGQADERLLQSLSTSWSTIFQAPQYDTRSLLFFGSPRSFMMDHSLLPSIQQIAGAGFRSFMSAPNGDFVAWFPDYYGFYGQDPVLDISPVEIIDCQIYHDDDQLVTHVGIIGDTTGIGQEVNSTDYMTTNGIVSIQDITTMEIMLHKLDLKGDTLEAKAASSQQFLNRYGIRPYIEEQNLIRTHQLEYMYAMMVFMKKWTDQFVSLASLTFMPEVYPGMRISMNLPDETGNTVNYKFYVTSVNHSGSRTSGFTTQVGLTAPMMNDQLLHYGANW